MYHADASTFKYKKTRRGVNAVCNILKDGVAIAVLGDIAEAIVADVQFVDAAERALFLAEAKLKIDLTGLPSSCGDEYVISEYARKITMEAEQAWVKAKK